METILTFTVCANVRYDNNCVGKDMVSIKLVQYLDKTVFVAEEIDGHKDVLVMKNPYYDANIKFTDCKENKQYWIKAKDRAYYLDLEL